MNLDIDNARPAGPRARSASDEIVTFLEWAIAQSVPGFGEGDNTVLVLGPGGFRQDFPRQDKHSLGRELVQLIATRARAGRHTTA